MCVCVGIMANMGTFVDTAKTCLEIMGANEWQSVGARQRNLVLVCAATRTTLNPLQVCEHFVGCMNGTIPGGVVAVMQPLSDEDFGPAPPPLPVGASRRAVRVHACELARRQRRINAETEDFFDFLMKRAQEEWDNCEVAYMAEELRFYQEALPPPIRVPAIEPEVVMEEMAVPPREVIVIED